MNDTHPDPSNGAANLERGSRIVDDIIAEIGKALIGQRRVVQEVMATLLAGGHVLIEGAPGLGKTLLARALAKTLGSEFSRIQFTPDLMPSDVTGHSIYDMKSETFRLRKGPVFTHLLLADEINRAPAKTQAALLEVMQEQQVTIDGESLPLPAPFMTLATQNPLEQEGVYPLPEAQLDRFLMKTLIDYPDAEEEQRIVSAVTQGRVGDALALDSIRQRTTPEILRKLQQLAARIRVDAAVIGYAVALTRKTRSWQGISVGAGPRAGLALIRAARATALMENRGFVTPDDVKQIAPAVLRHRLALSPEMALEGHSVEQVILDLLEAVPAPRR